MKRLFGPVGVPFDDNRNGTGDQQEHVIVFAVLIDELVTLGKLHKFSAFFESQSDIEISVCQLLPSQGVK